MDAVNRSQDDLLVLVATAICASTLAALAVAGAILTL